MNGVVLVGLNHKTAPVEMRERCRAGDLASAIAEMRSFADEAAILSTCNRFEVYAAAGGDGERIVRWIARRAGLSEAELRSHLYVLSGRSAAKHLFFVTSSLDSLIVGETQIRGQVRDAYAAAQAAGGVGPLLHRLFQAALRVSKEISDSTGVGRGSVSVAGAATDLAEQVFGDLREASALVLGAGETAELLLAHLEAHGVRKVFVLNRTLERAQALAERYGGVAGPLTALDEHLPESDVLLAAAGDDKPIVTAAAVRAALRRRRGRPMVIVDIAVPRGVDPEVDALDNVYRYDMDALAAVTTDALRHRRKDFLQCCTLIDGAALRLDAEERSHEAGQAIAELEAEYRAVGERELALLERRLAGLDAAGKEQIRRSFHRLIHKFLHMPVRALRQGDPDATGAVRRAFAAPRPRESEPGESPLPPRPATLAESADPAADRRCHNILRGNGLCRTILLALHV